jgi:glycine cleavage system H protein
LGDVVYVELPDEGAEFAAGADMAVVESAKAASDVYAPIAGTVVAANDALAGQPDLVNQAPEGEGWFVKIRPANAADVGALMDEAAYADYVKGL